MAGATGKSFCPTCGAAAHNDKIGRDGSPRWQDPKSMPLSDEPEVIKKRVRANRIRQQNRIGAK